MKMWHGIKTVGALAIIFAIQRRFNCRSAKAAIVILTLLFSDSVLAADYYVSTSGLGGNGSRLNPWGPSEINWSTLSSATNTLYFAGGIYTGAVVISHNTELNRLYIRPGSAAPEPVGIDGLVLFQRSAPSNPAAPGYVIYNQGNNVTIDGRKSAADMTINMKLVPGNNHGVVFSQNHRGNITQYLEITGMEDEQAYCGGGAGQVYSIDSQIQGAGNEISHNYIHNTHGSGDIAVSGNADTYGIVKVHHNTIERGTVNYVLGSLRGVDIYNNTLDVTGARLIYDNMHIYSSSGIRYVRIFNNTFINTGGAPDQTIFLENASTTGARTEHLRIYNNLFLNKHSGSGYSIGIAVENCDGNGGVDDVVIVNNTFTGGGTLYFPIRMYTSATRSDIYTNFKIENNIFYGTSGIVVEQSGLQWTNEGDAVLDYNIFNHPTNNAFKWLASPGGVIKTYNTVCSSGCAWTMDHPTYTHNIDANPLFVSETDLQLRKGSPAIDKGKDLSSYSNMDATADILGHPRAANWDLGAFEYLSNEPLRSSPPRNLRVP